MYYFGARYHNLRNALWYGVDPLAEKYAGYSSYSYCLGNPIILVDPDGQGPRWNRFTGGLRCVGGAVEAVVGGVGGVVSSETVVGAAVGYAVLAHGIDNVLAGAKQVWTGEQERSLTQQGIAKTARVAGANERAAETIGVVGDAVIGLGGTAFSLSRASTKAEPLTQVGQLIRKGQEASKTSSNVLLNTSRQLQPKFKHAGDFGVVGNYSKANAGKFSSAINQHINSAGVQTINGTYRGQSVIHYLNPNTGLNVISSPSGQFISGWKLNPAQLQNVLKHGEL